MAKDILPIRLQPEAIELLDALIPTGLYGASRAEVARSLILDHLKQLFGGEVIHTRGKDRRKPT